MVHGASRWQREQIPLKKLIDHLHIPSYLFLSREDDYDVSDIGKHNFRLVLLHSILSNANLPKRELTPTMLFCSNHALFASSRSEE